MDYRCGKCGAVDCKLWRQGYVFADDVNLICWRCLEAMGHTMDYGQFGGSDQVYSREIGHECWLPAVPDLQGNWWGYTSVPRWWCEWWAFLPNTRDDCTICRGAGKLSEYECCYCDGSGKREKKASV